MVLTVTKKVRKVKEEIVDLFPRPLFSSQIPPPPAFPTIPGTVAAAQTFRRQEKFLGGLAPKKPNPSNPLNKKIINISDTWHCGVAVSQHKLFGNERNSFRG